MNEIGESNVRTLDFGNDRSPTEDELTQKQDIDYNDFAAIAPKPAPMAVLFQSEPYVHLLADITGGTLDVVMSLEDARDVYSALGDALNGG